MSKRDAAIAAFNALFEKKLRDVMPQMEQHALLADLRVVSFNARSCRLCFGRRVLHGGVMIQIEHDQACPAVNAPMGTRWANAPEEE